MLLLAIEVALAVLGICGTVFYGIAIWSAYLFHRDSEAGKASSTQLAPVSILKPLKGADAETYAALRSHCIQEYGAYEIIFGINDEQDEAVPLVRRLMAEFPQAQIRLLVCTEVLGTNRKVSNLIHLLHGAAHQHVLVNDGDITVTPKYLRTVMSQFNDPGVGMVTCLYKGKAGRTFGSRLESLGISTDFIAGVLTSRYIEGGLHFGLGSTLAMRRDALEKIGGFDAVVDYLADDYQLGHRISAEGFSVVLAHEVVETSVPLYSLAQFWEHQIRWARTMRVSRPSGYRGLILTFGLPWAILLVLVSPHQWWVWALLAMTLLVRFALALTVGLGLLGDRQIVRDLWLIPVRDLFALAIWVWSYADDSVTWRGQRFRLESGRMYPVSDEAAGASVSAAAESPESHRR